MYPCPPAVPTAECPSAFMDAKGNPWRFLDYRRASIGLFQHRNRQKQAPIRVAPSPEQLFVPRCTAKPSFSLRPRREPLVINR